MSKRQIWLTTEECDLAYRALLFLRNSYADKLANREDKFSARWTHDCLNNLSGKFAPEGKL